MPARLTTLLFLAGLAACNTASPRLASEFGVSSNRPSATRASDLETEPLDAGAEPPGKWTQVLDTGDGEIRATWNAAECAVTIEVDGRAPTSPMKLEGAEHCRCFHISGIAGHGGGSQPMFVAVSSASKPEACASMKVSSAIYRFDGDAWSHVVDTQSGTILHLRANGPDKVEWKVTSAEGRFDDAPWSVSDLRKFPPPKPRSDKPYAFVKRDTSM